jgi:CheY-like chemotaxis protein
MTRTILIIDDDESEALLTKRLLLKVAPPIDVEWAESGEKGLTILRSYGPPPALILLDLKMSGISGLETLQRIRADERLKYLPVAIVTNSNLESDEREAMDGGADAFLHKRFDLYHFANDLKVLLERFLTIGGSPHTASN